MTYKIHFEHQDGTLDYFVISDKTIKGLQKRAATEIEKRNGKNPWSEEVQ